MAAFFLPVFAFCLIMACSKKNDDDAPTVALSITSFSPTQGEVGTEVTVIGEGFSTVSTENTVSLGTTPVNLTLAESGKLKFNVPEGSSTGKISVSVGTESVTSSTSFTVEEPNPVPLITGFSPAEGEWGDQITITGTGFSETDNEVTINGVYAETVNKEGNQITVEIGNNTRTGKIVVTNSYDESGESENDLTVFHGRWTQIADFGGGIRRNATAFVLNGKAYVGLGTDGTTPNRDLWEYHPDTDSWTNTEQELPGDGHLGCSNFVIDNTAYITSGLLLGIGTLHPEFWTFDGTEWAELGDEFSGITRYVAPAFAINGKGYYGTGYSNEIGILNDFWEYDPEYGKWENKEDVGEENTLGRYSSVGFALGNYGYIGTGYTTDNEVSVKDFWEYRWESDMWTRIEDVGGEEAPTRANATSFVINGNGYVGLGRGGDDENTVHNDFWEYNPDRGNWIRIADFPGTARYRAVAFVLDGKAFVGLGYDSSDELKDFWVFDPGN